VYALKRPNETYHAQWRVWAERQVPAYGPVNSRLANHQMPISRLVPSACRYPGMVWVYIWIIMTHSDRFFTHEVGSGATFVIGR
jgi:hypothetical protein